MTGITTRADLPQELVQRDGDEQGATMQHSERQELQREVDSLRLVYWHFLREAERLAVDVRRHCHLADSERLARGEFIDAVRAAVRRPDGLEMLRKYIDLLDAETDASPARAELRVRP